MSEYIQNEIMELSLNKFKHLRGEIIKNSDYIEIKKFMKKLNIDNMELFKDFLFKMDIKNKDFLLENKVEIDRQLEVVEEVINKFEVIEITKKEEIIKNIINNFGDYSFYKDFLLEYGDCNKELEKIELLFPEIRFKEIKNELMKEYLGALVDEIDEKNKKIEIIETFGNKMGLEIQENEMLKTITNIENENVKEHEEIINDEQEVNEQSSEGFSLKEIGIALIFVAWLLGVIYIYNNHSDFFKENFLKVKGTIIQLKNKVFGETEEENLSVVETSDVTLGWNKDRIYEGLREFQKPISEFETDGLKFRIDMIAENTFRLAIWNTGYSLESQPIEVIDYSFLQEGEDGLPFFSFMGSWHYTIKLDKNFKPLVVELSGGEDKPEIYQVTKTTYFSSPFENINTSNSKNSADNSNFSDDEIISVLDSSGLVANELKVIKKNNGKALVFINESYSNPSLSIVDMLNRTVEYTQYGSLSNEVDTTISDMNKDIYWVIKTKVFNKETYIDNIGLINMNLLTGETIFISEYPATMEGDWLSYPKESYDYLNIDINKAVEISSVNKLDSNGDGYEDFTINGRDFDGGGHLTFYAKNRGFSVN